MFKCHLKRSNKWWTVRVKYATVRTVCTTTSGWMIEEPAFVSSSQCIISVVPRLYIHGEMISHLNKEYFLLIANKFIEKDANSFHCSFIGLALMKIMAGE